MAKTDVFRVRVSAEEREALDVRAEAQGVKPSSFLRSCVRRVIAAPDLMVEERDALTIGVRVLRGSANNLNQLTRWANEGRSGLGPEVIDEMRELRKSVEDLRAAFGGYLVAEKKRAVVLAGTVGEGD